MTQDIDHRFLISVCASIVQGKAFDDVATLEHVTNWSLLLEKAAGHGVIPSTYRVLNELLDPNDPRLHLFRDEFLRNSAQSLTLAEETASLWTEFESSGIRAIFYKGLTTSLQIYGSLLARPSGDIDFLVPRDQVRQAVKALADRGYSRILPDRLSDSQESALVRFCEGRQFRQRRKRISADLHWRPFDRWIDLDLNFEELWAHRTSVNIGTKEIPVLCLEHLALLLCLHGAQHGFRRLKWTMDVALVTQTPKVDWNRVAAYAGHRSPMLGYARGIAHGLLGGEKVILGQRSDKLERLICQTTSSLLENKPPRKQILDEDIQISLHPALSSRKGLKRSLHILKIILRPTVADITTYTPSLRFFYRLLRIRCLVKKLVQRQNTSEK